MEASAAWTNGAGGVKVGGSTCDVEIAALDDQKDSERAIAGMESWHGTAFTRGLARTWMTALQRSVRWPKRHRSADGAKQPHGAVYLKAG